MGVRSVPISGVIGRAQLSAGVKPDFIFMARVPFFVLVAAFAIAACFPLKSPSSESEWADFTFAIGYQDCASGIYYDRRFDWPTGEAVWIDVPAWGIDLTLFVMASVAFVYDARKRLQQTRV